MKKIFIILFLFIASYSYGQSFKLIHEGKLVSSGDSVKVNDVAIGVSSSFYFDIVNASENMVDMQVARQRIVMLGNSIEEFCLMSCYPHTQDTSDIVTMNSNDTIKEDPNNPAAINFHVNFEPNITGTAVTKYTIRNINDDSDYLSFYLVINAGHNSIVQAKPSVSLLNAFPNPASSKVTIQYNVKSANTNDLKLVIKNLMGAAVSVIPLSQAVDQIPLDINHLRSGLYLYSIESNGVTLLTKKLSVK